MNKYNKCYLSIIIIFLSLNCFCQTKNEIQDYLKNRIEPYSNRPRTELIFNSCELKYYFYRTLPGNPPWTQEWKANLTNLKDVHVVKQAGHYMITLVFGDNNVWVTDYENDGRKDFVMFDKTIVFIFQKETIDDPDARKLVALIKKLGKMCGAKIIDI